MEASEVAGRNLGDVPRITTKLADFAASRLEPKSAGLRRKLLWMLGWRVIHQYPYALV